MILKAFHRLTTGVNRHCYQTRSRNTLQDHGSTVDELAYKMHKQCDLDISRNVLAGINLPFSPVTAYMLRGRHNGLEYQQLLCPTFIALVRLE